MKSMVHDLQQGSDAWHQFRAKHFGASEAAAVLGLSSYKTRQQLLREKATGLIPEVDDATQRRFDKGHEFEAAALPWAEEIIGAELYPVVISGEVDGLPLSASLDGLTMIGDVAFEHKTMNNGLAASLESGVIPDEYKPQMEQGMLLSGATKCLFMASSGNRDAMRYAWYESDKVVRKGLLAAWRQFSADLAEYVHVPAAPDPVAAHIDTLPALTVQIEGRVLTTNLDQFKQTALEFIGKINTNLKTDDDFATAEKTAKFCKDAEARLALVKEQAISQMATVDEVFRMIDGLSDELRGKRLTLEKAVKTRKDDIRVEIQNEAKVVLVSHIGKLNQMIGKPYMPVIAADFAGVMKGKKTVASLRDAVDTELARCKIEAGDVAQRIMVNLDSLRNLAADHTFLFADTAQIVLKANDDLIALVKLRISEHKEAEAKRLERERIEREAAEALAAKPVSVVPPPAPAVEAQSFTGQLAPALPVAAQTRTARPTDDQIIGVLALHYHVHESAVIGWLLDMDLQVEET